MAKSRMLTRHRYLFVNLLRREIRNRYVGSASGMFWALLHPLLLLAVYYFIFTLVFRPPELAGKHYLLFVAIGLWPWLAFQEALTRGTLAVHAYAGLIKKVAFPHEILIYSTVAATFALHLTGYLLVMLVLGLWGEPLQWIGLPLALGVWALLFVATCGLALFFSTLQVFLKDTEHVLSPALQILLYLAPILYPLTLVPASLRSWVAANPFSYVAGRLREALESGVALPYGTDLLALGLALGLWWVGRLFFLRMSPYFEDFV